MSLFLTKCQDWSKIRGIVKDCFSGDDDLINKYHIKSGQSEEACVEDTLNVLKNETGKDFEFYKVTDSKGLLCGFIGIDLIETDINYLTTFCLKKECRTQENKEELWQIINECFRGGNFICALYTKNARAINYLLNQGCQKHETSVHKSSPIDVLYYLKKEAA